MAHLSAPALDPDERNYAHCQVSAIMPVAAETFFDWYMREPIENFMLGTALVAPITGTALIAGSTYLVEGDERRIHFRDGTVARERILATDFPRSYSYLPYAYDNPIRLVSDYAKATMTALPANDGEARIVWDYAFHAKNRAALQVVRLFVALDWKRNLQNGLDVIQRHLAEHGTARRIDEARAAAA